MARVKGGKKWPEGSKKGDSYEPYDQFGPNHPDFKNYLPTKKEIQEFIEKHDLPNTRRVYRRVRRRLTRRDYYDSLPKGRDIAVQWQDAPGQIIYGTCRVGGIITCINTRSNNQYMDLVITIACHEINDITKVFINNTQITVTKGNWATGPGLYNDNVFFDFEYGTDSQATNTNFNTNASSIWTSSHRQRGNAYAYIVLKWDGELFADGIPEITFEVEGKPVYDYSAATTQFDDNAANIIADYLTDTSYGLGIAQADIDTTAWSAAETKCQEAVTITRSPYSEDRYTINGWFTADKSHGEVLEDMSTAMAGFVLFSEGKWFIKAGEYRTPTVTLDESDLRSRLEVGLRAPRSELFNAVGASFVDKTSNYEVTDCPEVKNATYQSEDGEYIKEEITLPFTTSPETAQRICKIHLEDNRQMISISAVWGLKAFELDVGDSVNVDIERYGWSSKVFEVEEISLVEQESDDVPLLGVAMDLKETASGIWTWSNEETTHDLSPNTNLPNPWTVENVTSLALASGTDHLDIRLDGTVFSRIYASWTQASDYFITSGGHIEVQYKKSADSSWNQAPNLLGDATFSYILDVQDGVNYDVRVRFVNALGVTGDWASVTGHTVVGKTAAPSDITDLAYSVENYQLKFIWTPITDLDADKYELRYGASWAAGTLIGQTSGGSFYWAVAPAGTYTVRIKAIDTSGNYSTTDDTVSVTVTAPGPVVNLKAWTTDNNVLIDWDEPATGTLLIDHYNVYKGATFASAQFLGKKTGTFYTYIELLGATYTYWLEPVDIADNTGTATSVTLNVYDPPDFHLKADADLYVERGETSNTYVGAEDHTLFDDKPSDIDTETTMQGWADPAHDVSEGGTYGRITAVTDQEGNSNGLTGTDASAVSPLLCSGREENFIKYSEQFDNGSYWSTWQCTVTANDTTAPDGNTTAEKLDDGTSSGFHSVYSSPATFPAFSGQTYRASIYCKAGTLTEIELELSATGSSFTNAWVICDFTTGSFSSTGAGAANYQVTSVGNSWYRVEFESTATGNGTSYLVVYTASSGSISYTGSNDTLYVWGAQVTHENASKEYAQTTTDVVHRGFNHRPAMQFDGGEYITSESAASSVWAVGNKFFMTAVFFNEVTNKQYVFAHADFECYVESGTIYLRNESGASWDSTSTSITIGAHVISCWHSSGSIYLRVDDGTPVSTTSGDTDSLTGSIYLGSDTTGSASNLEGKIGTVLWEDSYTEYEASLLLQMMLARYVYDRYRLTTDTYGDLYLPIDTAETWAEHFENNSAADVQDLIDAGYTLCAEPSNTGGYFEYFVDFGSTLTDNLISFTYDVENYGTTYTLTPTASYSTDGYNWTDVVGQQQIFASSFRYGKIKLAVSGVADTDFIKINNTHVKVKVKKQPDGGLASITDTVGSGTWIDFNLTFLDIISLEGTLHGTTAGYAVINFTDAPNPTGFYGQVYDSGGSRTTGTISWSAEGLIAGE